MTVTGTPPCVSFAGDGTDLPGYYRKYDDAAVEKAVGLQRVDFCILPHGSQVVCSV